MPPAPKIAEVQKEIDRVNHASGSVEDFMWEIVKLLHDRMLKYNWVGFYMLEEKPVNAQPRMLVLGPFQGAMTPHTRIPLNQGICGAAASSGKTMVVDDVSLDHRYLACHRNQIGNRCSCLCPRQGSGRTGHRQPLSSRLWRSRPEVGGVLRRSGWEATGKILKLRRGNEE